MHDDPRAALRTALDHAGGVVAAVPPESMESPTPCAEFDVRALLGHMTGVLPRIAHVLEGGQPPAESSTTVDHHPGDDWASAWKAGAALVIEQLDDAVLDRTVTPPFGDMPGRIAIGFYSCELTMHAWDLASAIGRKDLLDDDLAAGCLAPIKALLLAELRGGVVPFAPVVPVAASAGPYEQLAGWLGRDPYWSTETA